MSNLRDITERMRKPDATVIAHLESLLELARAGDLLAIAYVADCTGHYRTANPGGWRSHTELVGHISRLQHNVNRALDALQAAEEV